MRDRLPLIAIVFAGFLLFVVAMPAAAVPTAWKKPGPGLERVSELHGRNIYGPGGTLLGIVEDLTIGRDGRIDFLVLSRGSAFGKVGPFFLIPWETARPAVQEEGVTIGFDERTIEEAPGLRMERWPPPSLDPQFVSRLRGYYQEASKKQQ